MKMAGRKDLPSNPTDELAGTAIALRSSESPLAPRPPVPITPRNGSVAEWSKAHAWKVCRRGTVSRVRIPIDPPPTPVSPHILCSGLNFSRVSVG